MGQRLQQTRCSGTQRTGLLGPLPRQIQSVTFFFLEQVSNGDSILEAKTRNLNTKFLAINYRSQLEHLAQVMNNWNDKNENKYGMVNQQCTNISDNRYV